MTALRKTQGDENKRLASAPLRVLDLTASAVTRARAHPDLNQGPADLQSAALATELCTHLEVLAEITRLALLTRDPPERRHGGKLFVGPWPATDPGRALLMALRTKALHVACTWSTAVSRHLWSSGYDVSLTR